MRPIVLEVAGLPGLREALRAPEEVTELRLTREPTKRHVVPSQLQRDREAAALLSLWARAVIEAHEERIAAAMGVPTHIMERDLDRVPEPRRGDPYWRAEVVDTGGLT